MNARAWNTSTASAPVDDPMQAAIDAIDNDPTKLRECACRVIRAGAFDDLLWDQIRDSAMGRVCRDFVDAVRAEVAEHANENIYAAREFNREALEDQ